MKINHKFELEVELKGIRALVTVSRVIVYPGDIASEEVTINLGGVLFTLESLKSPDLVGQIRDAIENYDLDSAEAAHEQRLREV